MVMIQAFNGAGDTKTPTFVNLFAFWMVEIPVAFYLSQYTALAERGVYFSVIIAESIMTMLSMVLFLRGKWKETKV